MEMEGVEVPQHFLCPISLQIMRDPVALSTGISYDRHSIERWIMFSRKQAYGCPVTKQPLPPDLDLTPNHTLRRLIQAWCSSHALELVLPTPLPPVDKSHISALLDQAKLPQTSQMSVLLRLQSVVSESDRIKQCVEAAGAAEVLVSIIKNAAVFSNSLTPYQIKKKKKKKRATRNDDLIELLTSILSQSNAACKSHALLLLKSLVPLISPPKLLDLGEEFFLEIVKALRDKVSNQATKAALRVLSGGVSSCKKNKVKAAKAGAVHVLIELLLGEAEKRVTEMTIVALEQLCGCAEGRAEVVAHAAGIAVVSKKVLRVSRPASTMAVRILCSVAKQSPSPAVLQEMLQVGAVCKLCLMLQIDCEVKIQERVKEVMRLHSRVWRRSPCLTPKMLDCYKQ
ncbi:E3 ubiquitin-protein ligase [Canna indica]|uniref:U-box domain-containing protein n=1 Tax=Canna indica TaxID=4628 RepID=A0AAQ3K7A3_9LILI|nr:E3 ubiquitin-protein ligase [Canna indica]